MERGDGDTVEQITRGIAIGREKLDRSQIMDKSERNTDPKAKQRKKRLTDNTAAHTE